MQPGSLPESSDFCRFFAGKQAMDVGTCGLPLNCEYPAIQSFSTFYTWGAPGIAETPEARALAASKNHKEAEKRRRERINSYLDRLRSLLPCNSKTDKATLLAKVIQRVKELKQQSSETMQLEAFPSEADEITVLSDHHPSDGRLLIKASLSCEDRSDLIPDLIQTLRSLRLNPLRAEMATLGGRTRNVLLVTGDQENGHELVPFLEDALKSLVQRSPSDIGNLSKRRRVFDRRMMS